MVSQKTRASVIWQWVLWKLREMKMDDSIRALKKTLRERSG